MKIQYLTNILDPILGSPKEYRNKIKDILVSEKYASAFRTGKFSSKDFDFLLCDNGNFTRLSIIANKYKQRADELEKKALEYIKENKKVPNPLFTKRNALNKEIIENCEFENNKIDYVKITSNQLSLNPSSIIGAENTSLPILQICGAFHPVFKQISPDLTPFQKETIKLYTKQSNGAFGEKERMNTLRKYLVIHAIDYDSVVSAINNLKTISYDAIAISLGGALGRRASVPSVTIKGKIITFSEPHPESYILSITLLLGIRNNISKNTPVHILGLGSPILILLTGYLFSDFKSITIDSTATYKDVEVGYIYGNKNGLFKMDMFELAAYTIIDKKKFTGISPYYSYFEKKYPSNWKKLSLKFDAILSNKNLSSSEIKKSIRDKLEQNPSLFKDCVPFFLPIHIAPKNNRSDLRIARAFENYWVNYMLCERLSSFKSKLSLKKYVEEEVNKFARYGSKDYIKAIKELMRIIDTNS